MQEPNKIFHNRKDRNCLISIKINRLVFKKLTRVELDESETIELIQAIELTEECLAGVAFALFHICVDIVEGNGLLIRASL